MCFFIEGTEKKNNFTKYATMLSMKIIKLFQIFSGVASMVRFDNDNSKV